MSVRACVTSERVAGERWFSRGGSARGVDDGLGASGSEGGGCGCGTGAPGGSGRSDGPGQPL